MSTPILQRFFRAMLQAVTRRSKYVNARSPLDDVIVVTVEFGSYLWKTRRYRLWCLEHHSLCSPRQHDQHVIQLSGDVANKAIVESQGRKRQIIDGCRLVPVRLHGFVNFCQRTTKESSRPTAKHSSPVSPLVVLNIERLKLALQRERADPLLMLRWSCDFSLPFTPACCDQVKLCQVYAAEVSH